ncbi:MAG: MarR family transcriptional regulator [Lentilactobacillus diolivorans]|jgi:DNA-binding MarR family transcriptional regulator|uniref:Regulatory protein MarR n=2 Tax=Lentilactobacillus diolivorans TaxID=179838 RepID=A0A0R1SIF8_9LACO|nr:MarR family transcriptional regulator [Lentilactobacillus diolivorans]RRG04678.1 MAG: MarR family transcriptional regulator [Lactobacillus sp.]KRL64683.1 regulatory protein MarR [Lentilactobacillus diolivorans DSM 14421]MCH4165093.1 MarR family transcriptional regulator [Lentilactobacillus diolivorans]MDH5105888.1 MarR family transcriptional regulator [Lentilactobacillus diolivorans]GEP22747.1 MarR family transcriptional regulator [Lentilactobacillus diolivorans]
MKDILVALNSAAKNHTTQLFKITKATGLTISEWKLLNQVIAGNKTQEVLSEITNLDISTLSRQLKRLVEKEMLKKTAIGKDKRQLIYTVTQKGLDSSEYVSNQVKSLTELVFNHWTNEEKNLLKILINRLEKSLDRI